MNVCKKKPANCQICQIIEINQKMDKQKKAQMKIQEMAFVLLALVLLAVIGAMFFLKLSQNKMMESAQELRTKTVLSLLDRISNLPELECFCKPSCKANCIDENKMEFMKTIMPQEKLDLLFQGISSAKVIRVYPLSDSGNEIQLYTGKPSNASYQRTFINLCKYELSSFDYTCSIALIAAKSTQ